MTNLNLNSINPNLVTNQMLQGPRKKNLLENILDAFISPAVKYGAHVGEAGYQLSRLTDPAFRKSVLGQNLTEEEAQKLASEPAFQFVNPEDYKDLKSTILSTGKATAGGASYFIPMGGGAVSVGGKTLIPALTKVSLKTALPRLAIQSGLAGGLHSYSQSKPGEGGQEFLKGAGIGVATSPLSYLLMRGGMTKAAEKEVQRLEKEAVLKAQTQLGKQPNLSKDVYKNIQGVEKISPEAEELYRKSGINVQDYGINLPEQATQRVSKYGNKMAGKGLVQSQFSHVEKKVRKDALIEKTSSELTRYGERGSTENLLNKANAINDQMNQFKRSVLGGVDEEVESTTALKGVFERIRDIDKISGDKIASREFSKIIRKIPNGSAPGKASLLDLYDAQKSFGDMATFHYGLMKAKTAQSPSSKQLYSLYKGLEDDLGIIINNKLKETGGIQPILQKSGFVNEMAKYNPIFAKDLSKVNTWQELRSAQQTWVNASKLSENELMMRGMNAQGLGSILPSFQNPGGIITNTLNRPEVSTRAGILLNRAMGGKNLMSGITSRIGQGVQPTLNAIGVPTSYGLRQTAPGIMQQTQPAQAVSGTDQLSNILASVQQPQQQMGNQDALIRLMLADPKNAELYQTIFKMKFGSGEALPESSKEKERYDLGRAGLQALDEAESLYANDPSLVIKSAIPGQLGARQFNASLTRAVEGVLRARSGAAVPQQEVKRYLEIYGPKIGDSAQAIRSKFDALRRDLTAVSTPISGLGGQMNGQSEMLNAILQGGM